MLASLASPSRVRQSQGVARARLFALLATCAALACVPDEGWFVMGQGEVPGWTALEDGDELLMVLGGQGLLMFPMPLRGGGFRVPKDPLDYTDPAAPILDIHIDIEGHVYDNGHFERVVNYPIPLSPLGDGSFEFIYVTLFIPDELVDPCAIDGLPGQIHAELDVVDGDRLVWDREVVIAVPEELCAP